MFFVAGDSGEISGRITEADVVVEMDPSLSLHMSSSDSDSSLDSEDDEENYHNYHGKCHKFILEKRSSDKSNTEIGDKCDNIATTSTGQHEVSEGGEGTSTRQLEEVESGGAEGNSTCQNADELSKSSLNVPNEKNNIEQDNVLDKCNITENKATIKNVGAVAHGDNKVKSAQVTEISRETDSDDSDVMISVRF